MNQILDSKRGITLISLVITIIILIILSGVTITGILGDGGLVNVAREQSTKFEMDTIKENINLAVLTAKMRGNGIITEENLVKTLNDHVGVEYYTIQRDSETNIWKIIVAEQEFDVTTSGDVTIKDN